VCPGYSGRAQALPSWSKSGNPPPECPARLTFRLQRSGVEALRSGVEGVEVGVQTGVEIRVQSPVAE
jgi:hypothetical protein